MKAFLLGLCALWLPEARPGHASRTGFDAHQRLSLQSFLNTCTVPLICGSGDQAAVYGTGTPFADDGRLFLVTAGHVLDQLDVRKLALPTNPLNSQNLLFAGNIPVTHPRETPWWT